MPQVHSSPVLDTLFPGARVMQWHMHAVAPVSCDTCRCAVCEHLSQSPVWHLEISSCRGFYIARSWVAFKDCVSQLCLKMAPLDNLPPNPRSQSSYSSCISTQQALRHRPQSWLVLGIWAERALRSERPGTTSDTSGGRSRLCKAQPDGFTGMLRFHGLLTLSKERCLRSTRAQASLEGTECSM